MSERIVSDPRTMLGKPCISGTRLTVEHVLRELAAGSSVDQLVLDYPQLSREDVLAALEFAARAVELERVYSSASDAA